MHQKLVARHAARDDQRRGPARAVGIVLEGEAQPAREVLERGALRVPRQRPALRVVHDVRARGGNGVDGAVDGREGVGEAPRRAHRQRHAPRVARVDVGELLGAGARRRVKRVRIGAIKGVGFEWTRVHDVGARGEHVRGEDDARRLVEHVAEGGVGRGREHAVRRQARREDELRVPARDEEREERKLGAWCCCWCRRRRRRSCILAAGHGHAQRTHQPRRQRVRLHVVHADERHVPRGREALGHEEARREVGVDARPARHRDKVRLVPGRQVGDAGPHEPGQGALVALERRRRAHAAVRAQVGADALVEEQPRPGGRVLEDGDGRVVARGLDGERHELAAAPPHRGAGGGGGGREQGPQAGRGEERGGGPGSHYRRGRQTGSCYLWLLERGLRIDRRLKSGTF